MIVKKATKIVKNTENESGFKLLKMYPLADP